MPLNPRLSALESQEKGRWKAFIEGWKKLELAAAQSAEAMAARDEELAALEIHNALPMPSVIRSRSRRSHGS